jgi:hypothetical protein
MHCDVLIILKYGDEAEEMLRNKFFLWCQLNIFLVKTDCPYITGAGGARSANKRRLATVFTINFSKQDDP